MNHMPPSIAEDFEAIEAAVRETPRGRWFLAEFLRRHQARETRNLLHAVRRLEQTLEREARLGPRIVAALTGTAAAMTARIDTPPPALAEVVSALAEEAETIAAAGDAAKDEETAREAMRDAARRARALAGQLRTLARGIAEIAALCGERTPLAAAEPMVPAETERWFAAAPECFSPAADSAAEADVTVEADHVAAPAAEDAGDAADAGDVTGTPPAKAEEEPAAAEDGEAAVNGAKAASGEGRLAIFIAPGRDGRRAAGAGGGEAATEGPEETTAGSAAGGGQPAPQAGRGRIIIRHKSSSQDVAIPFLDGTEGRESTPAATATEAEESASRE